MTWYRFSIAAALIIMSCIHEKGESDTGRLGRVIAFVAGLALIATGCTQLPDLGCVVASDNCIAWRNPDGSLLGYMETVAGQQYVAGTTEGKEWKCVEVSGWTKEEWCAARKSLGVPPDLCVTSPRGEVRCAPCSAVETPTWGAIKALYR